MDAQESATAHPGTPPFPDMLDPPAKTCKKKKGEVFFFGRCKG